MKLTPTREEFKKLAKTANLVAVSTQIDTDLDTPVSMYYKLVGEEKGGFAGICRCPSEIWPVFLYRGRAIYQSPDLQESLDDSGRGADEGSGWQSCGNNESVYAEIPGGAGESAAASGQWRRGRLFQL